jgi:hypothetical protein
MPDGIVKIAKIERIATAMASSARLYPPPKLVSQEEELFDLFLFERYVDFFTGTKL